MVVSKYGVVASPQFLASQAGAKILESGGNAVDAAIAANAVIGVTQPYANGMGGDLFAIVYEANTGKLHGLNASGWAPAALSAGRLATDGIYAIDRIGVHAVTVPGCVAGWDALRRRFGTKGFSELLESAIFYAEKGFPLPEMASMLWVNEALLEQPGYAATYLPGGRAPRLGDTFRNPWLAVSLKEIAANGRDAFYSFSGPIAPRLVSFLRSLGGAHLLEDFADFEPEWVEPISSTYRGWEVFELPPNGQGVAALAMLNIMENFPLAEYGHNSARALHVMIEAKKLAYADLARYVGDPRFTPVPVKEMVSKELAQERARLIDANRAAGGALASEIRAELAAQGRETIYLSVADQQGNIVSLIQSNYEGHGTGMVAPLTGFSLHNRGAGFDLRPGRPNSLAGRKRPLHTIIPAFLRKGDITMGFGIMGGWNQPQAHAQFVANVVDFGMNPQLALEAPRFTKISFDGYDVRIESRVPESVREELGRLGHQVEPVGAFAVVMGNGEAVMRDNARRVNFGASDPRTDGAAIPEHPVRATPV